MTIIFNTVHYISIITLYSIYKHILSNLTSYQKKKKFNHQTIKKIITTKQEYIKSFNLSTKGSKRKNT
jgi:hypothetical protein